MAALKRWDAADVQEARTMMAEEAEAEAKSSGKAPARKPGTVRRLPKPAP
jgi:hypothetical protein